MVKFRAIPTLQSISYETMAKILLLRSPKTNAQVHEFYKNRETIRKYFNHLVTSSRDRLMRTAFAYCENEVIIIGFTDRVYPPSLFILETLFTREMEHLQFPYGDNFTTKHLLIMLTMLSELGENLQTLEILSYGFSVNFFQHLHLFNTSVLVRTLVNGSRLTVLGIPHICTDEVLKLVGEQCLCLQSLDVSYSVMITDDGLHYLSQNIMKTKNLEDANCFESSFGADNAGYSSFWHLTGIYPTLICDVYLLTQGNKRDTDYYFYRRKSVLCNTLRKLSLKLTHVSSKGLFAIFELMTNLTTLEVDLERFLKDLSKEWDKIGFKTSGTPTPKVKLTSIFLSHLSQHKFDVLKSVFPQLEKIKCLGSDLSLSVLKDLPTLKSIAWTKWANEPNVNIDIREYLIIQGENIQELTLIYLDSMLVLPTFYLSLSNILYHCPNLADLTLGNSTIRWGEDDLIDHYKLRSVCFYGEITEHALLKLFSSARKLENVFLPTVVEGEGDLLDKLCHLTERPPLIKFRVDSLGDLGNISRFLAAYPELRELGRINCTLHDLELDENLDLELIQEQFSIIQQLLPM